MPLLLCISTLTIGRTSLDMFRSGASGLEFVTQVSTFPLELSCSGGEKWRGLGNDPSRGLKAQ